MLLVGALLFVTSPSRGIYWAELCFSRSISKKRIPLYCLSISTSFRTSRFPRREDHVLSAFENELSDSGHHIMVHALEKHTVCVEPAYL